MRIKEISEKTGLSNHTIRYYESMGLLSPARDENGYRFYGPGDLSRLEFIGKAKNAGFSLGRIQSVIREVFDEGLTFADAKDLLEDQLRMINSRIAQMEEYKNVIESMLANCMNKGIISDLLIQSP